MDGAAKPSSACVVVGGLVSSSPSQHDRSRPSITTIILLVLGDGRWEFGLAGGSLAASDRPGLTLLPRSQTLETDKNGWSIDQACGSGLTKAVAETWGQE